MSIPQPFIQDLLARIDLVEVVGRYVPLRKAGANYSGLCPFHDEKSPSFSVSPSKQFFHCFGCGKSGNAIGFLMEHAGMGFVEAVEDLSRQVGLVVPDEHANAADKEKAIAERQRKATLSDVLEKAGLDYRQQLRKAPHAVQYLKGRGLSGEVAQRYGLGYAPQGWRHLAGVFPHYDDPLLAESGLVIVGEEEDGKRYDRFRDRVMFPIRNVKGECIGFGGRVLSDEKPKYLNSPETPVFHKGSELYGLYEARRAIREAGHALVTEGYMDVVALAQHGFENAVATLGTACTSEHIAKLFRFTDTVVFSFDGDRAGRAAARKALEAALPFATDTRSIKFLFLPAEHDPDSFVRAHGESAFARRVADAIALSRFVVEAASEKCDLGTPEGRAHMASNARPLWQLLPDGVLKRQLLGEFATLAQVDSTDLQDLWEQAAQRSQRPASSAAAGQRGATSPLTQGASFKRSAAPRPASRPRRSAALANRSDHAVRLLLSHAEFLDTLSQEDNTLLCEQEAPYGALFSWIETQFHEHGAQPWAVLQEALRGHPCEATAERIMTGAHAQTEGEASELQRELRGVLNRMLAEQLRAQETEALAAASTDPLALERYRALQTRRVRLEQLAPSV